MQTEPTATLKHDITNVNIQDQHCSLKEYFMKNKDFFIFRTLNPSSFYIKDYIRLQSKIVKKKVNLSQYMPWRHLGGEEV
jgi:hypothetical protein